MASMQAGMSFHRFSCSSTARAHLTRGGANDAPTSSNGSASADSGTSSGTSTESAASSSLNVESRLRPSRQQSPPAQDSAQRQQ
eukprot:3883545-Pleurochrysis_carterae.AAC.1